MKMLRGKYVMTDRGPILIPESFSHDEFKHFNPTSAAKFIIDGKGEICTYGDSFTLKMKSESDDALKIKTWFGRL